MTVPSIKKYSTPDSPITTFADREPVKSAPKIEEPVEDNQDATEEDTADPDLDIVTVDDDASDACMPFAMVTLRKTSAPVRSPGAGSKGKSWIPEKPVNGVKKQAARRTQSVNPNDLTSMGTATTSINGSHGDEPRSIKDLEGIPFAKVKIVNQTTSKDKELGLDASEALDRSTSSIQIGSSSTLTDNEFSGHSETEDSSTEDNYLPKVRSETSLRLNLANIENEDFTPVSTPKTPTGIISRDIVTKSKISPQHQIPDRLTNLKLDSLKSKPFPERSSRYEIIEYLQSLPDSCFEEGKLSLSEICRAFQENRFSSQQYRNSTSPIPEEQVTFERAETKVDVVEFANTTEINRNKPLKLSSNSIESLGQVLSVTDEQKQTFLGTEGELKQEINLGSGSEATNKIPQSSNQAKPQQTISTECGERKPKSKLTRSQSSTMTSTESDQNSLTIPTTTNRARTKSPGKIPTLAMRTKTPPNHETETSCALKSSQSKTSSGTLGAPKQLSKTGTKPVGKKPLTRLSKPSTRLPTSSPQPTEQLTVDICNKHKPTSKAPSSPKITISGEKSSPRSPNSKTSGNKPKAGSLLTASRPSVARSSEKLPTSQDQAAPNSHDDTLVSLGMSDLSNIMDNIGLLMKTQENRESMGGSASPRSRRVFRSNLTEDAEVENNDSTMKPGEDRDVSPRDLLHNIDDVMFGPSTHLNTRRKPKSRAKFERAQTLTHNIAAESG